MKRDYQLEKRKYVLGGVIILIVLVFIIRLFTLQIMSDDYKRYADSNALLQRIKYPPRGLIYDRQGRLLVFNQPAYDITVVMKEVEKFEFIPAGEEERHQITISGGISTFPCMEEVAEDANTLIRYAEHALYNAKKRGKNKIVQFSHMNLEY